jgi:hypothetical protein
LKVANDPGHYFKEDCVLKNVPFPADPVKAPKGDLVKWLRHWAARQAKGIASPTFINGEHYVENQTKTGKGKAKAKKPQAWVSDNSSDDTDEEPFSGESFKVMLTSHTDLSILVAILGVDSNNEIGV